MDISVLERQRAVLQRLYEQHQSQETDYFALDSVVNHHHQRQQQGLSNANNWQYNSSLPNRGANSSIKERKAEFDIEEDESKEKGVEAEEATEEKSEITTKTERETSTNNSSKASEVQNPDYIHVRARRGQATDSHSLAERARREKISKKMKCLQDLVPGCNKVTGKAGMLDEIINYVQSLQKQVEFDIEEEESKEKGVEAEEATEEKSEITTKTERETSTYNSSKAYEARSEKIRKKMKCLQDLVPGCNKVIGKAGMLDEIINYVQSLQKQVELRHLRTLIKSESLIHHYSSL